MKAAVILTGTFGIAVSFAAMAQDAPMRGGRPAMASEVASDRMGQPMTLDAPPRAPRTDPTAAFASVYARARAPRIAILWNRLLTDDLETGREEVTEFSAHSSGSASSNTSEHDTRWGTRSRSDGRSDTSVDGQIRSTSNRLDTGRRAARYGEAIDFDMERGFMQAFIDAGVRLVDRTSVMRAAAIGGDITNAQAIEMKALLERADWTVEVTPLDDGADAEQFKIVVRDIKSGSIVAMATSDGEARQGLMPYVAGSNGFVRATPRENGPVAAGRQVAFDTMAAIGRSVR